MPQLNTVFCLRQQAKKIYGITIHALHAMGWITLEQLKEITVVVNDAKMLATLSRKELVYDMDNFQQKVKWVR